MNRQTAFLLGALIFTIVGMGTLIITGMVQYEQDRARFQDSHQEQKK